jgi:hydrogenase maturation factor
VSSCLDGHCITCSDEAIPMRVSLEPHGGQATCVDGADREYQVVTELVEPVAAGDRLLVHAGVAIARVSGW